MGQNAYILFYARDSPVSRTPTPATPFVDSAEKVPSKVEKHTEHVSKGDAACEYGKEFQNVPQASIKKKEKDLPENFQVRSPDYSISTPSILGVFISSHICH